MKKSELELWAKTLKQMRALYDEISLLSKKSPTDGVNKFKLRLINTVLETANKLLSEKNKPFDQFTVFTEDDLPNNSDVVIILSQYLQRLEELEEDTF